MLTIDPPPFGSMSYQCSIVIGMRSHRQLTIIQIGLLAATACIAACRPAWIKEGGLGTGGPLQPTGAIDAVLLLPKSEAARSFQITEGPDIGTLCDLIVEPNPLGWRATLTGINRIQFARREDSTVVAMYEEDLGSHVRVFYDPPVVTLPGRLVMSRPVTGESAVEVRNIKDNSLRARGRCRYHIELIGRQSVTTPAGEFDTYLVRTQRMMDLDMAKAKITWISAYARGRGQIAQRLTKEVHVLELFTTTSTREIRLSP